MERINMNRVILGGLLAGLVIDVSEYILNMHVIGAQNVEAMKALGRSAEFTAGQIVFFNVWCFIAGVAAVWLYAAIRPRFGPGQRTALLAGAIFWGICYVMGSAGYAAMGLFPTNLILTGWAWGLCEVLVGTYLGARIYKE